MTAALTVVAGLLGATAAEAVNTVYYVDCALGSDSNDGTSTLTPWKTLTKVNSGTYAAGMQIRFKGGTRCKGTLQPSGSGTATAPITLTSYEGRGAIDGLGAQAAIFLRNNHGWTVTNLEITNTGPPPAPGQQRVGIYVLREDAKYGQNYNITNNYIHDVNGCDCRYPAPTSAAILFHAGGDVIPTGFSGITIQNNIITAIDREGIATSSDWQSRDNNPGGPGFSWVPFNGLRIVGNSLSNIGGDGVMVVNGSSAVVEGNTLKGFNERSADFNAGMLAYNSDNTLFQFNDVQGGKGTGMAFDLDGANNGGTFQYNFSRDNAGGFFMICAQAGEITNNGIVRYNVSQNDTGAAAFLGVITMPCTGAQNIQIYNNSFYSPNADRMINNGTEMSVSFSNNIFYGRSTGTSLRDPYGAYSNNLYHRITTIPASDTKAQVGDPWFVAAGTATGIGNALGYELTVGARGIGTGATVANNGGRDFFGHLGYGESGPNIGAYEGFGISDFTNTADVNIPDYPRTGVTSAITTSGVPGTTTDTVKVGVDIKHTYSGDLIIELIAPDGSSYRLKDEIDSDQPNVFKTYYVPVTAEAPNGSWKLRVQDTAEVDTGFIDDWSITFLAATAGTRLENLTNVNIPDATGAVATSPVTASGVPGYRADSMRVFVDIKHPYRGDMTIDLVAPDGSAYRLRDPSGSAVPSVPTTYLVDVSPEAPNGVWKLQVLDDLSPDAGFIDAWNMTYVSVRRAKAPGAVAAV